MQQSTVRVRIIAVIAALITMAFAYYYIRENEANKPTYLVTVVAARDIPENTKITSDMLTLKEVLSTDVVPGSVQSVDDAVDMFASTNVYSGEQILKGRLLDTAKDTESAFSYKVPEGMRTVTISINPTSSVAGLLHVGDHVDIISNYTKDNADGSKEQATKFIAENIEIAALDTNVTKSVQKDEKGNEITQSFTTVTMFVTPELAKAIIWNQNNGSIVLTLRSPLDESNPDHATFVGSEIDAM